MATVHDLAEKANAAFVDDNFLLAVNCYTQAINLSPQRADLYAERAQSNIKLNNFTEAVDDANRAIELDRSMAKAYFRKGTACIKLEKYHTAKEALVIGASLAQNDTRFAKLIKECDVHIEVFSDENIVRDGSSKSLDKAAFACNGLQASTVNLDKAGQGSNCMPKMDDIEVDKPKYRHAFYQKPDEVVVTIFAKGIPTENVVISFGEQILSVIINTLGENPYHFQPRLFGKIVPEKCRYEVLKTKVEIRLVKAEIINWKSLEYSQEPGVLQQVNKPSAVISGRPSYPSSKQRLADWDKLEAEVKREEKEETLDGDAALNKMFGDIYRNADEDMRRAMNKSFVESNGTVLSTCWKEVGRKKIDPTPPDSMELRKWEY